MADDLQKGNMCDIHPIPFNSQDIKLDEEDDDNDDNEDGRNNEKEGENYVAMEVVSSANSICNIQREIKELHENNIVDDTIQEKPYH